MTSNCEDTPQAKARKLLEITGLVKAAASKGQLPASLVDLVSRRIGATAAGQFRAGLSAGQLQRLVDQALPGAVAAARRDAAAGLPDTVGRSRSSLAAGGADRTGVTGIGPAGSGDFFDPTRSGPGAGSSQALPGRPGLRNGSASLSGVSRQEVTAGEVQSYLSGALPGDDDEFAVALWIGPGKNPMLMLEQLSYAKELHNTVVRECARYYKRRLYGDPDYPTRLGRIIAGIVSEEVVRKELAAGPTSRHLLGQAVNFSIVGVDDARVVEDLRTGAIPARVGTYAEVNGIHATLPFTINGVRVEGVRLWADLGTPGFVGYDLPA